MMSNNSAMLIYPRAWGHPQIRATIKASPDDFIVQEQLNFSLDGSGEHLYLYVRKCGLNTQDVVASVQRAMGVSSVDIGVAGMKDKQAVTDQWISVRTAGGAGPLAELAEFVAIDKLSCGQFALLESVRHSRKLRRGAHQDNFFCMILRDVRAGANQPAEKLREGVDQRLKLISEFGFPNYFGPQRFGIEQRNLLRATQYFASPKRRITRTQRGFYLSAARSAVFNSVCAARIVAGNWNTLLSGEPAMLQGSHSFFLVDSVDDELQRRCHIGDIHPSAPLWGRGNAVATAHCAEFEQTVLDQFSQFCVGLAHAGLTQERRALRAYAHSLQWQWLTEDSLQLTLRLDKGVYATSLLAELIE